MSTTLPPGWLCLVFLLVLHSFSVHKIVSEASCATLNYCSGHGKCTVDSKCVCDEGWGAAIDVTNYRSSDCSARTCPAGVSWGDLPATNATGFLSAHRVAECSDRGICDRSTGVCRCDQDFTGKACERTRCPNDCSGHGQCLSMMRLANTTSALPLSAGVKYQYNTTFNVTTWDQDKIYGCLCDSSWSVGLNSGQRQDPEWFGPDCSMRHCPSADNPRTTANELDCFNKKGNNAHQVGKKGNLCHVDCANQGVCDYATGICSCFKGHFGVACEIVDALASPQSTGVLMDGSEEEVEE